MKHLRLVVLLLLLPASALAQNATTPGAVELYPTFEAVGVRLAYSGDANLNGTARIEWRKPGDATWLAGAPMARITNNRWAGSILWLAPNTSYEARVVVDDADGGGASATATTRTRVEPPLVPSGRKWWVATSGSDANTGIATSPLRTIAAAMAKAQPGDEVRVRPGTYYEQLTTPRSGTASAPIHLVADAPGVVLDGADPALLHRTDWRADGGGVYSIAYATSSNRLVCCDSLMRLYKYASLADLQGATKGITQGFTIEGGRLYVKLEDGSNPSAHTMSIARYNVGLMVGHSWWHVAGFEIRHFGNAAGGSAIQVSGSSNWLADNFLTTLGGRGVFLRLGAADNLIERNHAFDPRIGGWPWSATKAHDEEGPMLSNRGGRGNVFRNNRCVGGFDGLDANDGPSDENVAADADYHGNYVGGCGDDAIETDTVSGINLRLWNNVFTGSYSCVSIGPVYQGPEYVLYNQFTDYTRNGFKFALTSTGVAWLCHNTLASTRANTTPVWPTGPYANVRFRNNVLVGNGLGACNDDAGESQAGCSFDGDQLHAVNTSTLIRWKNTNYSTLSAFRTATGFEAAGKSGDPMFASQATGDYTLRAGSPAIDAGLRLPGLNDGRWLGAGPDIGAHEFASSGDTTPPGQVNDLR